MGRSVKLMWGFSIFFVLALCLTVLSYAEHKISLGESLFKAYCADCHLEGGNIIRPDKTLAGKDREKYGIKTADDIINLMRNPQAGMTTFDKTALTDDEAKAVAEYVITTFK